MGTDMRLDCVSTGTVFCSFLCDCCRLGSFVRADHSSPSPSSSPCIEAPAEHWCRQHAADVPVVMCQTSSDVQCHVFCVFCVSSLIKTFSEWLCGAAVMSEKGLVQLSHGHTQQTREGEV